MFGAYGVAMAKYSATFDERNEELKDYRALTRLANQGEDLS
jgi:hypothetical protein